MQNITWQFLYILNCLFTQVLHHFCCVRFLQRTNKLATHYTCIVHCCCMHIEVHHHCKCVMSTLGSTLFYTPTQNFVVHFVVNTIFLVQHLCCLKKCSMMLIMKFLHNRNSHQEFIPNALNNWIGRTNK
jgi:hypothetical protein